MTKRHFWGLVIGFTVATAGISIMAGCGPMYPGRLHQVKVPVARETCPPSIVKHLANSAGCVEP